MKKMKACFKSRPPKTGLEYNTSLRLLYNTASAHKARLVTEFLESEKVTVLLIHRFETLRLLSVSQTKISIVRKDI